MSYKTAPPNATNLPGQLDLINQISSA